MVEIENHFSTINKFFYLGKDYHLVLKLLGEFLMGRCMIVWGWVK